MEFCYICGADYQVILDTGNNGHDSSCRHWRAEFDDEDINEYDDSDEYEDGD
jgi:hypothetical protein